MEEGVTYGPPLLLDAFDVFVSHRHRDAGTVRPLVDGLRGAPWAATGWRNEVPDT